MIDYLSFSDNTILIIIDIHTSSFRSIFALLQCLCHCRPWIIQNYKIMSLFLTRCCACLYLYSFLYLYFSKIYPMVVWEMRRSRVFLKCSIVVFPTNASETLSAKSTLLTGHRRQSGWGWCGKQFENMGNIGSSDLMMMIAMTLMVGNDLNWVRLMIFFSPFDGSLSSITDLQKDPSMIADDDHMMMMMVMTMMIVMMMIRRWVVSRSSPRHYSV